MKFQYRLSVASGIDLVTGLGLLDQFLLGPINNATEINKTRNVKKIAASCVASGPGSGPYGSDHNRGRPILEWVAAHFGQLSRLGTIRTETDHF